MHKLMTEDAKFGASKAFAGMEELARIQQENRRKDMIGAVITVVTVFASVFVFAMVVL